MLHEIRNVKQERGSGRRRWFESDGLDVIVWFDARDEITGFQLCYDLGRGDHAFTWREAHGFGHHAIDLGDRASYSKMTPILQPDGKVPWRELIGLFEARCETLEPALRELIRGKLAERSGRDARRE